MPPLGFRYIQAADFSTWDGSQSSPLFQSFARDIKNNLAPPVAPEPDHLEPELTEMKRSAPEPVAPPPAAAEPPAPAAQEAEPTEPAAAEPKPLEPAAVQEPPPEPPPPEIRQGRLWVGL